MLCKHATSKDSIYLLVLFGISTKMGEMKCQSIDRFLLDNEFQDLSIQHAAFECVTRAHCLTSPRCQLPSANHLHLPRLIALWKLSFFCMDCIVPPLSHSALVHAFHPLAGRFAPFCSQGRPNKAGVTRDYLCKNNTSWHMHAAAASSSL